MFKNEVKNSQNKGFKFTILRKILPIFVIEEFIYNTSQKLGLIM